MPFNFNPPAPCGAGRWQNGKRIFANGISIHPPRAGRDVAAVVQNITDKLISIHPPRAGRDCSFCIASSTEMLFQSTRPVRGGTPGGYPLHTGRSDFNPPAPCGAGRSWWTARRSLRHFNPPAPCGAGLLSITVSTGHGQISIHPPRAGRDTAGEVLVRTKLEFQSTRPVRGGTVYGPAFTNILINFNPPAPCGAGQKCRPRRALKMLFQSTRPVRGGTSVST